MPTDRSFQTAYRELEKRMKALAEADGDVFVPNPEPESPVQYVLIRMEPSLGRRPADQVRSIVRAGSRNFLFSMEDFILHFCIRRYLCGPAQRYHITDFSKGAMPVDRAGASRGQRYDEWYALLQEEIDLVAIPDAGIVAVGKVVAEHLKRQDFRRSFTRVIHYSGQAAHARNAALLGSEESFQAFRNSVAHQDLVATARDVLRESRVPAEIIDERLSRLMRMQLTISRKKLIFSYKLAFESVRSDTEG